MPRPPSKILAWEKAMGVSYGSNQERTAALIERSSQSRCFLLVAAGTNWLYMEGMRLVVRKNKRCCGFTGAEVMFPSPSELFPAMSALVLMGDRGFPRYC